MSEVSDLAGILAVSPEHAMVAGGTVAGAWALKKVIGPTLNSIGNALGEFSEYRVRNLLAIGDKIHARLGDDPPELESKIHPRVAKVLIEEGTWLDDEVAQEYFAGMLLGATQNGDSEGDIAYFARMAANLAPQHLRLHHAVYEAVRFGPEAFLAPGTGPNPFEIYVPGIGASEMSADNNVIPNRHHNSIAHALQHEGLLGTFQTAGRGPGRKWIPEKPYGRIYGPTQIGAELFEAAYGRRMDFTNYMLANTLPETSTPLPRFSTFMHQESETGETFADHTTPCRGVWIDRRDRGLSI